MANVPTRYAYLTQAPIPPLMVRLALGELGRLETPGSPSNPTIVGYADEVDRTFPNVAYNKWAANWYNDDAVPWCGLFVAAMCARTALDYRSPPKNYLSALSWAAWGEPVDWRGKVENIHVGDIGVLIRKGGGHVGIIVGVTSDKKNIIMVGGNQGDKVSIAEFSLDRVYAIRRPVYRDIPEGARYVAVSSTGQVSTNEQ